MNHPGPIHTRAITLAAFLAIPFTAHADTQLERFETLSEQMTAIANEAMVMQIPELEGNLPAVEWDDDMRSAFACVVDQYRIETGDDALNAMLDQMEAALPLLSAESILAGEINDMAEMPEGLTEERSGQIMNECGVLTLFMERMMESGAASILASP